MVTAYWCLVVWWFLRGLLVYVVTRLAGFQGLAFKFCLIGVGYCGLSNCCGGVGVMIVMFVVGVDLRICCWLVIAV